MLRPSLRPKISKPKQIPKPRMPPRFHLIAPILPMHTPASLQLLLEQMLTKMPIKNTSTTEAKINAVVRLLFFWFFIFVFYLLLLK